MRNVKKWLCMLLAGVLCCVMLLVSAGCDKIGHKHSYGEWVVVEEENCQGHKERICACGEKEKEPMEAGLPEHAEIMSKLHKANYGDDYAKLLSVYQEVLTHVEERECDMLTDTAMDVFVKYLLNGKWTNEDGKYISLTYVYQDYDNTVGSDWLGTNLPNSKVDGNDYYYYLECRADGVVYGYQDTITEEKTDNYHITFESDRIILKSLIADESYTLKFDTTYNKVEKDNAKYAYFCLAKTLKDPANAEVMSCYVDREDNAVYAVVDHIQGYTAVVRVKYKLYEKDGHYYAEACEHNCGTNIDLEELNAKIQEFAKK